MMTAKRHRMKELCEITSSKRIFAADYQPEGIPFYRGKEITEKHKGNLCDYDIKGAKCQLTIDSEVIEIKSPGGPLPPVTMQQMKAFNAPMRSRNPKLHYVFAQIEVAEERGLGLASLKNRAAELGLPTPLYTFEEPYLTLKIFRSSKGVERVASGAALQKLNRNERNGWDWLVSVADATAPEYADALKVSRSTALNHLNRFVEHGLAIRSGAGPATRYKATIE